MSIRRDLDKAVYHSRDQSAYVSEIVDYLIKNEPINKYKTNIYQKIFPKRGRDELTPTKSVDGKVTYQSHDTARRPDGSALRLEDEAQHAAAQGRKQKYDREMCPVREHLEDPAEAVKCIAIHRYMQDAAMRGRSGKDSPVFVLLNERGLYKTDRQNGSVESRCKLDESHRDDRRDQNYSVIGDRRLNGSGDISIPGILLFVLRLVF